jgi:hypothetical protein
MLEAYPHRPIGWTSIMDVDGVAALRKCAKDCGIDLSSRQDTVLGKISGAWSAGNLTEVITRVMSLARVTVTEAPFLLAPIDLEHMMCSSLLPGTVAQISPIMVSTTNDSQVFAERLGSKHRPSMKSSSGAVKTPAFRRVIAEMTPTTEFDPFVRMVFLRWLALSGSWVEAKKTWNKFVAAN